ncbi:MAG: hypothetical protein ACYDGW_11985 [Vulcanimicrobiaceae bacterium]
MSDTWKNPRPSGRGVGQADLDDALPVADCIEDIANTLTHLGDGQSAAQLLGYADAVRLRTASPMNVGLRAEYDGMVARTRAALGLRSVMSSCGA